LSFRDVVADLAMDVTGQKRQLRREIVAQIRLLDPDERGAQQAVLSARFVTLPGLGSAATVLLYVTAFPEELDTRSWLAWTLDRGLRLLCPRVDRQAKRLRLHQVSDLETDLVRGVMGIPEPRRDAPEIGPSEVDWVLVPGLAFDQRGNRLGRGGGYYDRLLPTLRPGVPRWALCLDSQWVDTLPVEPHDMRLDGVVSPAHHLPPRRGGD
jgi:5-formyltetrahydrofolate cyclo-ligase